MTHYAWTIKASGLQDVQKVTTLPELHDVLQLLKLPGIAPPAWLTVDPWREELSGMAATSMMKAARMNGPLSGQKSITGPVTLPESDAVYEISSAL
jgi:hypothetical protein